MVQRLTTAREFYGHVLSTTTLWVLVGFGQGFGRRCAKYRSALCAQKQQGPLVFSSAWCPLSFCWGARSQDSAASRANPPLQPGQRRLSQEWTPGLPDLTTWLRITWIDLECSLSLFAVFIIFYVYYHCFLMFIIFHQVSSSFLGCSSIFHPRRWADLGSDVCRRRLRRPQMQEAAPQRALRRPRKAAWPGIWQAPLGPPLLNTGLLVNDEFLPVKLQKKWL